MQRQAEPDYFDEPSFVEGMYLALLQKDSDCHEIFKVIFKFIKERRLMMRDEDLILYGENAPNSRRSSSISSLGHHSKQECKPRCKLSEWKAVELRKYFGPAGINIHSLIFALSEKQWWSIICQILNLSDVTFRVKLSNKVSKTYTLYLFFHLREQPTDKYPENETRSGQRHVPDGRDRRFASRRAHLS